MKIKNILFLLFLSYILISCNNSPDKQLLKGIEKSDIKLVQKAIDKGADIKVLSSEGRPPLMVALTKGNDEITQLLLKHGADINQPDAGGSTVLYHAVLSNNKKMAEFLIENGADVNLTEERGVTLLMMAINGRVDKEIIRLLLEKGANPNAQVPQSGNALLIAITNEDTDAVKLLLDYGADPNTMAPQPLLFAALFKNNFEITKLLLENSANPNMRFEDIEKGNPTPLIHASGANQKDIAQLLLQYGADANLKNANGLTALMVAINNKNNDLVKLLIDNGVDINFRVNLKNVAKQLEIERATPLMSAIFADNYEAIKLLFQNGVNTSIRTTFIHDYTVSKVVYELSPLAYTIMYNKDNNIVISLLNYAGIISNDTSLLYTPIKKGDLEMTKLLINNGCPTDIKNAIMVANQVHQDKIENFLKLITKETLDKNTEQLLSASSSGNLSLAEDAIRNLAFINFVDTNGNTPLINAVSNKNAEMVKLLLDNGANTNIRNKQGDTALILAVREGNIRIAKLLLDHHANANVKDNKGNFVITTAEYYRHQDMVQLLKEYDAKDQFQINENLLSAVRESILGRVKKAIADGADVNVIIKNNTALHMASQSGDIEIAKTLIDNKANVNIKNRTGITPLMVASYYGKIGIVKLLLNNGADTGIISKSGKTALSIAENKEHKEIVSLLKQRDAFKTASKNGPWKTLIEQILFNQAITQTQAQTH